MQPMSNDSWHPSSQRANRGHFVIFFERKGHFVIARPHHTTGATGFIAEQKFQNLENFILQPETETGFKFHFEYTSVRANSQKFIRLLVFIFIVHNIGLYTSV